MKNERKLVTISNQKGGLAKFSMGILQVNYVKRFRLINQLPCRINFNLILSGLLNSESHYYGQKNRKNK